MNPEIEHEKGKMGSWIEGWTTEGKKKKRKK